MTTEIWTLYVAAVIALMSTPGPSQLLMLSNTGAHGLRRVCFFYGGKIEEQGTPSEFFGNPQRERTQQFLSAVKSAD